MIKIVDIKLQNNKFIAKYIPEDSQKKYCVEYDFETNNYNWEEAKEYGATYGRMAVNGLKELTKDLKEGSSFVIPKEKIVMWY